MTPRQYDLQQTHHVGRLDLEAEGLARYVDALLRDWAGPAPDITSTLGWSVDNGSGDITTLMAASVGRVIHDRFREDPEAALRAGARFEATPPVPASRTRSRRTGLRSS